MTHTTLQTRQIPSPPSTVDLRLTQLETQASASGGASAEGEVTVGVGVSEGTLTSLGLAFTPTRVQLTMSVPSGGLSLTVLAVGDPTSDGFSWRLLNGVPDGPDYKFNYRLS